MRAAERLASGELLTLDQRGEMGSGVRIGGIIDTSHVGRTKSIWRSRPPVTEDGRPYQTLHISAHEEQGGGTPGDTVTIRAEAGTQWGGLASREFAVGDGLSAALRIGLFESVDVKVVSPGFPAAMKLRFVWSLDYSLLPSPLYTFLDYPTPGTLLRLPEGTAAMFPDSACIITFNLPQFGTTFTKTAAADEEVEALWGAFSCNVVNRFILKLRGL
jgi:hypothetical protein